MRDDYRVNLAFDTYGRGQYHESMDILRELLGDNPNDGELHALLAACLLQLKRLVGAEYEIGIALGQAPHLPLTHLVSAQVLFYKRKLDLALEACDEALRLNPELVRAHLLKASIFQVLEKRDEARASLVAAASMAPNSTAVLVAMGEFEQATGDRNAAMEFAMRALEVDAGSEEANILMGELKLAFGDPEEADYHAKFAITQNPASESALRLFVNIRMRKNKLLGLWWRINSWFSGLSTMGLATALITGYLVFNLGAQILRDTGYGLLGGLVGYGWLALVIYSWVGIPYYKRALAKELAQFQFNPKF